MGGDGASVISRGNTGVGARYKQNNPRVMMNTLVLPQLDSLHEAYNRRQVAPLASSSSQDQQPTACLAPSRRNSISRSSSLDTGLNSRSCIRGTLARGSRSCSGAAPATHASEAVRSLVRDGQTSSHKPRLVVSRSTRPPLPPPPPREQLCNRYVTRYCSNKHTPGQSTALPGCWGLWAIPLTK
jgi:hypothetical protein